MTNSPDAPPATRDESSVQAILDEEGVEAVQELVNRLGAMWRGQSQRLKAAEAELQRVDDCLKRVMAGEATLAGKVAELRRHVDRLGEWCRDSRASAVIAGSIYVDMKKTLDGDS